MPEESGGSRRAGDSSQKLGLAWQFQTSNHCWCLYILTSVAPHFDDKASLK